MGMCHGNESLILRESFHLGKVPRKVLWGLSLQNLRGHPSGAANQAQALRAEGVTVNASNMGELMVDFGQYGWFPRQLPSDAAAGLQPFDDSGDEG